MITYSPETFKTAVVSLQIIACVFIMVHGLLALNTMTMLSDNRQRIAHCLLVTAGGTGIVSCTTQSDSFECLFAVAVALYLLAERRHPDAQTGTAA